ncbi:TIGR02391 family protein [Microbacterium paludicola]|uniref:TIGR02391 family protein n=1 Tax=Microbacterium paludicola TaxID=300019 RepID=UPI00090347B7|nr:TIGR02391 family protein [Microbacterium paludicola]APF34908.1 hypothetical protein BO218_12525 [Microbacterium paludicola]
MGTINLEWAGAELQRFVDLTDGRVRGDIEDYGAYFSPNGTADEINAQWAVVEKILDRVAPGWSISEEPLSAYDSPWLHHLSVALREMTLLQRRSEIETNLGDGAPVISVSRLHPWVWEGAQALWRSGHYRSAVIDAILKVNAETQNKVGRRDVTEKALFDQAFSDAPASPGKSRLRRMRPDGSETFKSMQRGARCLAEGIFAGIRNPLSHEDPVDIPEQVALEHLAGLSILARWVDDSCLDEV